MSNVFLLSALELGVALAIGSPAALLVAKRERSSAVLGWLLLMPAFGVTVYLGLATGLHALGVGSRTIVFGLLVLALLATILIMVRDRDGPTSRSFLLGVGLIAGGAFLVIALNTPDIRSVGLDVYFPLTNADTFDYLGNVDRIRSTGWGDPNFRYPAGYAPTHVVFRAPSMVLVADFADLLGLETHAAFFLALRVALPVIVLASAGIVALLTDSRFAAAACFTGLTLGNFFLHAVLQQFNSSITGGTIAPVILAAAIWTARKDRTRAEFLVGAAAIGFASGTMAMTSPEAAPFYLIVLAIMFVHLAAIRRPWRLMAAALFVFAIFFLIVSSPVIYGDLPYVLWEFRQAGNGHPGDWLAIPAFIIQAAGLATYMSDSFSAPRAAMLFASTGFLAIFGIAFLALACGVANGSAVERARRTDLLVLFSGAAVLVSGQLLLYARGSGYALLKLTDYFAFLPCIVVAVGLSEIGRLSRRSWIRQSTALFLIGACVAYGAVAVPEKHHLLRKYRDVSRGMPGPDSYRLGPLSMSGAAAVVPDLHREPLYLFLYANRWGANQVAFQPDESKYFTVTSASDVGGGWMARFPRIGLPGLPLADITYGESRGAGARMAVVPLSGQVHIHDGGGWLDPEGESPDRLTRWLGGHGDFVMYGGSSLAGRALEMELDPGPDLRPDNAIEVTVAQRLLATVAARDLPKRLVLPMSSFSMFALDGTISVTGVAAGPRQIRVAHLRTTKSGR